ncbi:FliH/SctL family protein [Desulfosporosinus sp. BG]|uniref:FliH/SctL family protein n=1 Tax=Desulfosporosinus sp. BG TaxID=1633135 RepID=UPI000839F30E|nr:FliH/SctL family protein [Desulfosporosinus sp. BG]ODA42519.1 Flagellar assembly protein FliH [Desulfosporosinus sp. BG]
MRSFTKGRVVKNYDVEVSTPRIVEWTEGFQQLDAFLTVLTEEVEEQNPVHPEWLDTSVYEEEALKKVAVILAEAEAGAQAVLAQAESRAQEVHAQAQADLERLRQEVVETAQAEGYQAGFAAGEAEGKRLSENVNKLFRLAQQAVQEEYAKVDEDLLQLALKIAERLVRSSITVQPQRLVEIIRALTLLPQERIGWRLHVATEDAVWLEKLPEGSLPPCPWVMDKSLNQGDCFLECQEGVFDARLAAQLDKLEHILREELEHGSLESINSDSGTN